MQTPTKPSLGRPRTAQHIDRPRALYVYMEDSDLKEIKDTVKQASRKLGRTVSVSEYVRIALKYAADHKPWMKTELGTK